MSEYGPPTEFRFGFNTPEWNENEFLHGTEHYIDPTDVICEVTLERIRAITESIKEGASEMAIAFQGDKKSAQQTPRGIPFLKVENVAPVAKPCTIIAVKLGQDNKGKDQVMLKINYSGPVYLWSLRLNNPNIQHLIEMFGSEESNWKDKEFLLGLEPDEFSGRNWPRAFPPAKKEKAAR